MPSNWDFVGAAYGLTWIVLAAYTLYLFRRRRGAEELARKEEDLR